MTLTNKIAVGLLFACSLSYGQMKHYSYQRELKGISGQWHKIVLPDDIFGKTAPDLTDIRIFGIAGSDTVEAPYLLRRASEKIVRREVAFKTLNTSHTDRGYYFTFEIPTDEPVTQITLEFAQQNFDWRCTLQGSHDQSEWFTVAENYRILSIKNELTDFRFTEISFPSSKYRFFRLFIPGKEKPELTAAHIARQEITEGIYRKYRASNVRTRENKQARQTEIDIELPLPVPVSRIRVGIADTFDYYRPTTVQYLADSFQTEKGWKYRYVALTSGTLNSIGKNEFATESTTARKLKVIIHNQDNRPLTVEAVEVSGYVHELVVRFTDPATYFLTYGNEYAAKPQYDIDRFADNIPEALPPVELGNEATIEKGAASVTAPLFTNKAWLWAVMAVIILLLGGFSVKMMKKK